jgi:hypothetical protein
LNSAVSKTGSLNSEVRRQEIEHEFLHDVLTDFNLHHHSILSDLDSSQQQWIADRVLAEIRLLMRK